jgi:hypothetical protein
MHNCRDAIHGVRRCGGAQIMRGVEDAAPYNIKKETTTMPNTHARASILDIAKSIALVNMLAFHAMYDIVYIFGVDAPWFKSLGAFFWQQFICFTFIICSGAVLPLSRKPMRHAATLFGCGCLLTLITYFFMPEEVIHFGILSLLGASAFITALLLPLFKKLPATPAALAFFALFAVTYNVPRHGYPFRFFYWLGFPRLFRAHSVAFPLHLRLFCVARRHGKPSPRRCHEYPARENLRVGQPPQPRHLYASSANYLRRFAVAFQVIYVTIKLKRGAI